MVLSGVVNKAPGRRASPRPGVPAVGLSGRDGGLIRARLEPGLGRVGTPERVDAAPISRALGRGLRARRLAGLRRAPRRGRQRQRRRGRARPGPAPWAREPRLPLGRGRRARRRAGRRDARRRARRERLIDDGTITGGHGPQGAGGPRGGRRGDPRGRDRGQGAARGRLPGNARSWRPTGRPQEVRDERAASPVYDRDLVLVSRQGRAALRRGGPRVPRLRGRHRRERPRLRRPQGRRRRSASRPAGSSTRATSSTREPARRAGRAPGRAGLPVARSSSATRAPRRWKAAIKFARRDRQAGRAAPSSSPSSAPSTAARWARSRSPGPRSTASRSSRWCPACASALERPRRGRARPSADRPRP